MLAYTARIGQSKFVRNVAIVATGTAGAQAIGMAFTPFITRLYGPEAFGVLGTFMAILTVITPLAALSYPIAIVLPKKDIDAIGLVKMSLQIALGTSLFAMIVLLFSGDFIVEAFNLQAVEPFVLLIPLAMLFSACMAIGSQWVLRKKMFKLKAQVAVLQSLWLNIAKIGFGYWVAPVAAVLVVLATCGSALHAILLYMGARKNRDERVDEAAHQQGAASFKELAWRHRDFAYYRTPQIFLNAASQSMPVLMLASFFGPGAAGFYSLGKMVLGLPSALIGQSVASVFYPRFNEAVHAGENARKLLIKATAALAGVGLIPYGIVVASGPVLFSLVFGDEWRTAGAYAQWLALWLYVGFVNRPSIGAIPVLAMQGFFLVYEVGSIALRAIALVVGFFYFNDALVAVAMFSVASVFLNALLIFATIRASGRYQGGGKF